MLASGYLHLLTIVDAMDRELDGSPAGTAARSRGSAFSAPTCVLVASGGRQTAAMVMPNSSNKLNEVYLTEQRVAEQFQIERCTNWKRAVIVARLGVGSSIN